MFKLISRAALLALITALLPACSWFQEKPPEYVDAKEVDPIKVPEGLDEPRYRTPLVIMTPEMRIPTGDELNPGPPRTVNTGGRKDANSYLQWSAQGVYLQVRDTQESTTRRLGYAIDRSGMQILEEDGKGKFRFEYYHLRPDSRSFWDKMAFWRSDSGSNFSGIYRAEVVADGEESRVYLYFDSGEQATTASAEHILGIFMERKG